MLNGMTFFESINIILLLLSSLEFKLKNLNSFFEHSLNMRHCNRPLPSFKRHNLSCENDFYLQENENSFPYQRLSTQPRFDTETRCNSKMVQCLVGETPVMVASPIRPFRGASRKGACENIRFSISLFAAGDFSRETSPAVKGEKKRIFSQAKNLPTEHTIQTNQ